MVYIILAAGIFLLELFMKNRTEKWKEEGKEKAIWGGALRIRKYHNRGAFLNTGEKVSGFVAFLAGANSLYYDFVCGGAGQEGKPLFSGRTCPSAGRRLQQYL